MNPANPATEIHIPLLRTLGIRLVESEPGHAVVEVDVEERHGNYLGGAHGGLIATLIDTVCFFPRPFLPSGRRVATVTLHVSYIRPAAVGDRLTARSEILHLGRRTASLCVRVCAGDARLVAHGAATLMILDEADD